jgi:XTP/dITP diphosphohydrolase
MRALFAAHQTFKKEFTLDLPQALLRNSSKLGTVEIFNSYEENSLAKARFLNRACHYPILSDDSGLEVEALGGAPGVFSRRYAECPTGASEEQQTQANLQKLLDALKQESNRKAKFVCVLSLIVEGVVVQTRGELQGTIATIPKGVNGFGYDSVFIPDGDSRTLAECSDTEKNRISHRYRAFEALMQECAKLNFDFVRV